MAVNDTDHNPETECAIEVRLPPGLVTFMRAEMALGAHADESELIAKALRFYAQNRPAPAPAENRQARGIFTFGRLFGY